MKNKAEPLISLEDFCKLNNADKQLFLSVTTEEERKKAGIEMEKQIRLNKHVTIGEIQIMQRKGVTIEVHGFNFFAVTDNSLLVSVINEVNKK